MKRQAILSDEQYEQARLELYTRTNQIFFWLFLVQWAVAVAIALLVSPRAWSGRVDSLHVHVKAAIFLGGLLNVLPLWLIRFRPHWWGTRHAVAVVQMLWSGVFI